MNSKIMESININNYYIIPKFLIKNVSKLSLDLKSTLLLIYLLNNHNNILFNHIVIAKDLSLDKMEVLKIVNDLVEKGLIEIKVIKNDNGIVEERLSFDGYYNKAMLILMEEENKSTEENIYQIFEKEFGKTLSPIECEIISGWIDSKISEEVILLALKEAIYNGVFNFRYIDKILYEWKKKGIKTAKDVTKSKKTRTENIEEFDYDWLNENKE